MEQNVKFQRFYEKKLKIPKVLWNKMKNSKGFMEQNVKFQRFYEIKTMKDYLMNKGRNILIDGKRRNV